MKRYVVIYGGTELTPEVSGLIEDIAYALLEDPDIVIVTGGFKSAPTTTSGSISTDISALRGAQRFIAANKGQQLKDRFETWLPAADKDRKEEAIVRFEEGNVIKLAGKSAQARRFELVKGADAILTIKGKKNTAMVLDLALSIDKPALPLPFTGGDSFTYWNENTAQIKRWFDIDDAWMQQLAAADPSKLTAPEKDLLVKRIVEALQEGIQRRCLVLMDYDPEPAAFYENVIKPAIAASRYKPVRIDKEANEGNILKVFLERLKDCDVIIADITEANPNVMYELGHAHAQNHPTILFSRKVLDETAQQQLPFYLQMDSIENCDGSTAVGCGFLQERIKKHLERKK